MLFYFHFYHELINRFCEKVLSFIAFGGKIKEACQLFSINHCSIHRWKNTKKATGSV